MALNNFGVVGPLLFRSAQPDQRGIADAKLLGVDCVFRLNADGEMGRETEEQLLGFPLDHNPIGTYSVNDSQVVAIARKIHDCRLAGHKVLVHCEHGWDRTGLIVAAGRLVFDKWSLSRATEERKEFMLPGFLGDVEMALDHTMNLSLERIAKRVTDGEL